MNMYQILCVAALYLILSILDKKFVSKEEINYSRALKMKEVLFSSPPTRIKRLDLKEKSL